jgi:hypothetical protein
MRRSIASPSTIRRIDLQDIAAMSDLLPPSFPGPR